MTHRLMLPDIAKPRQGETIAIHGDEARHALRVKRVDVGETVEILDGMGMIAQGEVKSGDRRILNVVVRDVSHVDPMVPRVDVISAIPKGGRINELVRGLSQVGAASWIGLEAARSESRVSTKLDRLRTIGMEAAKQCGRAWMLELGETVAFKEALEGPVIVADASGEPYEPSGNSRISLLIGPEGGWTDEERSLATAGAQVCSFGAHVMRIEVAAVVAAGIVIDLESRLRGRKGE